MTTYVNSWIILPDGRPVIEWLCGDCDGYLFLVDDVEERYGGLTKRMMHCTRCGAPDIMSAVVLKPPPPGYAVYHVMWVNARFRPEAFPKETALSDRLNPDGRFRSFRPVRLVAASRQQAYELSIYPTLSLGPDTHCLINGEIHEPSGE